MQSISEHVDERIQIVQVQSWFVIPPIITLPNQFHPSNFVCSVPLHSIKNSHFLSTWPFATTKLSLNLLSLFIILRLWFISPHFPSVEADEKLCLLIDMDSMATRQSIRHLFFIWLVELDGISSTIVFDHCRECYYYSMDTESDTQDYTLSLLQVHSIPVKLPSAVLLIRLKHLPSLHSLLFEQFAILFRILFRRANTIYSWGAMEKEVTPLMGSPLLHDPIEAVLFYLQLEFNEWYRNAVSTCLLCCFWTNKTSGNGGVWCATPNIPR